MKRISYILSTLLLLVLAIGGCDYLDVVPDEIPDEKDAFKNTVAAERFLYSCYSYIPNPRHGSASLDFFTGDEVVTAFEHETFASFPKGNFTANNTVISYWETLFNGIKQCYLLKSNIDKVPAMPEADKVDYVAQADFLIAYYHFLLLRCYGPIILVKEEPLFNTLPQDFLGRSPYDECVEWINQKFEESIPNLPATRSGQQLGLATSTAAKALIARMYLYAASPLYNGNSAFYSDFTDVDGTTMLMPTTPDANKWVVAKTKTKEAIDAAEGAGYRLYVPTDATFAELPEPADPTQRALRFTIIDKTSKEIIWADTRREDGYSLQNKSRPWYSGAGGAWNGVGPSVAMLDRFYTKNGLPIDEDPSFNFDGRFDVASFADDDINGEGETSRMNLNREPRYYAWISFHGGYYEIQGKSTGNGDNQWPYKPEYKRGIDDMKLVTFYKRDDNCGKHNRTNNYSPSAFLNKKGVSPAATVSPGSSERGHYPWPVVRLSELYLSYAETCVETNDLPEARKYVNKVRERAGVPSVETAWGSIGVVPDQAKMREIVRRERMIELYLENHNFWDIRRWLLAEKYFNVVPQGLNAEATTMIAFSRKTDLTSILRKFISPEHYLMPIPYEEVNKNDQLGQNPGY